MVYSCLRDHMNRSWREPDPDQRYSLAYDEFLARKYGDILSEGWVCEGRDEEIFEGPWWTQDGNAACVVFSARLLGISAASFWQLPNLQRASFMNHLDRETDLGNAYYGHIGNFGEIVLSFEIMEPMYDTD